MPHAYSFHPALLLRTPALPLAGPLNPDQVGEWLANPQFMEALYLASPALHDECRKWQQGEVPEAKKADKLLATLARYHGRMSSRCTPFGLFAGCSVVAWGAENRVCLAPDATTRHTRLDMHYVCALAHYLAAQAFVQPRLRYFPNSSLYAIGDELRYVEYHYPTAGAERAHQISSVQASDALRQVLAASAGGQRRETLARVLLDDSTEPAEAAEALAFIDELVAAQVLVSELEPTVTGAEFLQHVGQVLARLDAEAPDPALGAVRAVLDAVGTQVRALDARQQAPGAHSARPAAYEQIIAALHALPVPIERGKLFQVDLLPGTAAGTLDRAVQAPLLAALHVLRYLAPPAHNERLAQFKQQFQARYEAEEVPLLEVLDTESGIPYSAYGQQGYAPLIDGLVLPAGGPPESARPLSAAQHFMHRKLREAAEHRQYAVALTLAELAAFAPAPEPLPPSFSVMFRVLGGGQVLLEHAGGSSAANLLSRFAHAEPDVAALVGSITATEQAHNPDVVFAEICHLPASRAGNILLRPSFRALELPYLAQSALPPAAQLPLQELGLSLRQGQLHLRCRRTNREVVPRLGSAHNYGQQALPVYQFLCDLQTQGLQPRLGFEWRSVAPYAKFTPRLTHEQVVLQPAGWHLEASDLRPLFAPNQCPTAAFAAFRRQWQLPRWFVLAEGDHELLVDADHGPSVAGWLAAVRPRATLTLKEFLFDPATSVVRDAAGRPYVGQFVASLLRPTPCYPNRALPAPPAPAVPRTFALGSEWLYYKLYCGLKVADRVLVEAVRPLTETLLAEELIDQWFFVRYADPDPHLRLRLHLPAVAALGTVVQRLHAVLAPFVANGYVWKHQTDTYRRELERYGAGTMALSETLFYHNSRQLLAFLAQSPPQATGSGTGTATDPDTDGAAWLWGARAIDELLTAFAYARPQKLALLRGLQTAFAQEFALDKTLKRQLDARYRQHRAALQAALAPAPANPEPNPVQHVADALLALHRAGQLEVGLDRLLPSYLHMLLNRAVAVQPRLHELLIYDFLCRHYQSEQAQQRA